MDSIVNSLASLIQGTGAFVIGLSAARAILIYVWSFIVTRGRQLNLEPIRLDLGRGLVLGLEFLIGADILKSIVAPTWQDIAILAAIIAIRTVLSFSIEFELAHLRPGRTQESGPTSPLMAERVLKKRNRAYPLWATMERPNQSDTQRWSLSWPLAGYGRQNDRRA